MGVFCDLSKPFDCVNHETLIRVLHHFGITGRGALDLLASDLANRVQKVVVNNINYLDPWSTWECHRNQSSLDVIRHFALVTCCGCSQNFHFAKVDQSRNTGWDLVFPSFFEEKACDIRTDGRMDGRMCRNYKDSIFVILARNPKKEVSKSDCQVEWPTGGGGRREEAPGFVPELSDGEPARNHTSCTVYDIAHHSVELEASRIKVYSRRLQRQSYFLIPAVLRYQYGEGCAECGVRAGTSGRLGPRAGSRPTHIVAERSLCDIFSRGGNSTAARDRISDYRSDYAEDTGGYCRAPPAPARADLAPREMRYFCVIELNDNQIAAVMLGAMTHVIVRLQLAPRVCAPALTVHGDGRHTDHIAKVSIDGATKPNILGRGGAGSAAPPRDVRRRRVAPFSSTFS
ncbi:hypothetical protein EVAR_35245_1 [Eumeta japonica]|uniref:Reverse transcriptase domain-containing protein n=1 Tax=Eumeta variegata TaxID=151549 RepID=A0A4C1VDQ2_EUMVA|nr:hypothetical protein EVAR_35245_1 [Eumeta japonica]